MRTIAIALLLVFDLLAAFPTVGIAASFQGGQDEAIAELVAPLFKDIVNIIIPADQYVLNFTMQVTGLPTVGNSPKYPEGVEITLNGTTLWRFNRTGYGPLGRQDRFSSGEKGIEYKVGPGGGANTSWIRLPKEANVQSAVLELSGIPPMKERELLNYTGYSRDQLGFSVSGAGDVNGDGFDDAVMGAPNVHVPETDAGGAYLYLGGQDPDTIADLLDRGMDPGGHLGRGVSDAGDVNNDGYGDVVVLGARGDSYVAHIFFGRQQLRGFPDVFLKTPYTSCDGLSVSCAGDVNNDGYDDVIVGVQLSATSQAYIYFGGQGMDQDPDITLTQGVEGDGFGASVSGAGDVNKDGFDDVVVGTPNDDAGGTRAGRAYIYFGGKNMDANADVILTGAAAGDRFGQSVSGAGDVDDDGYADLLVGAPCNDAAGADAGRAYVFFGGWSMDTKPDVTFTGAAAGDWLGVSVSTAGDFNTDGVDDVIIGSNSSDVGGVDSGCANVFFGGRGMDNNADVNFSGAAPGDQFGCSVSNGGDLDGDAYGEVIIGAYLDDGGGMDSGRACVYSMNEPVVPGVQDVGMQIGSTNAWKHPGFLNDSVVTGDFARAINDHLQSAPVSGTDFFGNSFVDVPLNLSAESEGSLTMRNLSIVYRYDATVPDFATVLNAYLIAHRGEQDPDGNMTVPVQVRSQSAGRVKLSGLNHTLDLPPELVSEITGAEMDEDTLNTGLLDFYEYFRDDCDPDNVLDFELVSATNSSIVDLSIFGNRYLTADASTGPLNDNWTGTVEAVISCADRWGHKTESNRFSIFVRNVNDPPIIVSKPVNNAEPGVPYEYDANAIDGDGETLLFSLTKAPLGMTIDSESGKVLWVPTTMGNHAVVLAAEDAESIAFQSFNISVPNRPPRITSVPPSKATAGIAFTYNVTAEDSNMDSLSFSLKTAPPGMEIQQDMGNISWIPPMGGNFQVSVIVSDSIADAKQDFVIDVNGVPRFIGMPVTNATVGLPYIYDARAPDLDGDPVSYSLATAPPGMKINPIEGTIEWIPSSTGNYTVIIEASDGKGGVATQEFVIKVSSIVKCRVAITPSSNTGNWQGKVMISGTVTEGSRKVERVEARIDSGEWANLSGIYNWSQMIDTTKLGNGRHSFEVRAFDGTDYSDSTPIIHFNVQNPTGPSYITVMSVATLLLAVFLISGAVLFIKKRKTR